MWLLRNDQKGLIYRVVSGKQHIVSRKDGDLLLVGDQSISRKHAQLFVDDENQEKGIVLKDLESKYGTFVIIGDGELTQLSPNQQVTLKCGDSVRFGIQWNSWSVDYVPLLVATSTLTQGEKADVKRLVTALGGQVVSDWQPRCTHLTMNKLTITVKVVCALAACQPIVTPAFWQSFAQALSSLQATLPDCRDFVPPLAEAVLNPSEVSFAPDPARGRLFSGLTFVASSPKQLNRIKSMVAAAGGEAVEFSARVWTEDKLMRDKIVLMQHSASDKLGSQNSQVPDGYLTVARKLRTQGVRCIPESEIGLGVLYCSMTQYCNPRYNVGSLLGSSSSLEATQPVNVICPDSEESTNSSENPNEINTVPRSPDQSISKKRSHEDLSDDDEQTKKKPDTRGESEDLFDSQVNLNTQPRRDSSRSDLTLEKASSLEVPSKVKASIVPSLDMFAPSGKPSSSHNQGDIRPSCEDLFESTGSRKTPNIKMDDGDEFSFTTKKCKPRKEAEDAGDEFSFASSKKNSIKQQKQEQDDDFAFTSIKRSSKRNRGSDADMFASSNELSLNKNNATQGPSKVRRVVNEDEFRFGEKRQSASKDNVFAFPEKPKRKRNNESLMGEDEGPEVKIAVFAKENHSVAVSRDLKVEKEAEQVETIAETKNLITYSKLNPAPINIKKEVEDEEMDELAKELYNKTIVIVKPLVVARQKSVKTPTGAAGKNFKKFQKVVGMNKRTVPHIIGGSDLVAYRQELEPADADDLLPNHLTPQNDEWGFQNNRNRGMAR